MDLIDELRALVGTVAVLDAAQLATRAAGVRRTDHLQARALVRPANTEEVTAVMRCCHRHGLTVVTQGGLTGLVHGADAGPDDIILSTERMRVIEAIDPVQRCATVQAGVTLQALQDAVDASGLMFPLDLGARGSATLGGNAATNAGGNRVVRYGMMRDMVLGLEVVLADGTVVCAMNALMKNNTGYDLKQLFIGSEGTLGVITRLVLRLREKPGSVNTALIGLRGFGQVVQMLAHMDRALGGTLSAYEVMWPSFYRCVTTAPAQGRPPIGQHYPFYVLIESQGSQRERDNERFHCALETAFEQDLIADAGIAQSQADNDAFWSLRDDVSQLSREGPSVVFDISLPLAAMDRYVGELVERLHDTVGPAHRLFVFGHLGDGNLHIVVQLPQADLLRLRPAVQAQVYECLAGYQGSISAEHGIGLEKKPWLALSRSPQELALMRAIKRTLDPDNRLNPGKIL